MNLFGSESERGKVAHTEGRTPVRNSPRGLLANINITMTLNLGKILFT